MARRILKRLRNIAIGLSGLVALALATLAMPVPTWRTGEIETADLPISRSDAVTPARLWIDTDAACGHGRRSDPDDCLALLGLARSEKVQIVGVSTVFGNADLTVTDRTTRELAARLSAAGTPLPEVWRGAETPMPRQAGSRTEASGALANTLAAGPLTILALGPLTNIAATLRSAPDLADRVDRVIAVMGHRPGHLFHPSEGQGDGLLFGHGPVFSDLNFRKDPAAVGFLLETGVPITLVPYEVARDVMVTQEDLDRLAASGPAGAWVANGATGWLEFWNNDVGLEGFYPFDLVAARYVIHPERFLCGRAEAWVTSGWAPGWLWMVDSAGLLVAPPQSRADGRPATYCPELTTGGAKLKFRHSRSK